MSCWRDSKSSSTETQPADEGAGTCCCRFTWTPLASLCTVYSVLLITTVVWCVVNTSACRNECVRSLFTVYKVHWSVCVMSVSPTAVPVRVTYWYSSILMSPSWRRNWRRWLETQTKVSLCLLLLPSLVCSFSDCDQDMFCVFQGVCSVYRCAKVARGRESGLWCKWLIPQIHWEMQVIIQP